MRKEFRQNTYGTESRCIIGPENILFAGKGPENMLFAGKGLENMLFAGKGPENMLFAGKGPENILFAGTSLRLSGRKVYRQEQ